MSPGKKGNILLAAFVSAGIFLALSVRKYGWDEVEVLITSLLALPLSSCIFFRREPPIVLYAPVVVGATVAFLWSPLDYAVSAAIPTLMITLGWIEDNLVRNRAYRQVQKDAKDLRRWIIKEMDEKQVDVFEQELPEQPQDEDWFEDLIEPKRRAAE